MGNSSVFAGGDLPSGLRLTPDVRFRIEFAEL
jgi:hypothetical protein